MSEDNTGSEQSHVTTAEDFRHTRAYSLLRYFDYAHLPQHLQQVSAPLANVAFAMVTATPESAEQTAGLRKLLEAKDCFVRAALDSPRADKAV